MQRCEDCIIGFKMENKKIVQPVFVSEAEHYSKLVSTYSYKPKFCPNCGTKIDWLRAFLAEIAVAIFWGKKGKK